MRLYLRKILMICLALVFLWLVACLVSMRDVSPVLKRRKTVNELDSRMDHLQNKLDSELADSKHLLKRVNEYLKENSKVMPAASPNGSMKQEPPPPGRGGPVLPVLVIACDRVTVKRCLDNLVKFRPSKDTFPIIVSQDCNHNATYHTIRQFADRDPSITLVRQPDQSLIPLDRTKIKFRGYYNIARHYRFALGHVLGALGHEAVIIVEDDLDISPDFYEYFLGTYPLLIKDPTLWCVSAWNDNGKKELVDASRPDLLHRTDFFPGLGWMLRRETWQQLAPHWPDAFFDDWLRDPANTQGRACIRPEISRTYSFGKVGVSKGLFFDLHLRYMQLNTEFVEFTKRDLSYLLKSNYDPALASLVASLPRAPAPGTEPAAREPYSSARSFRRAAKRLGLMDDFRSGIPRTAYLGIVQCYIKGTRIYLAPDFEWHGYDPSWG